MGPQVVILVRFPVSKSDVAWLLSIILSNMTIEVLVPSHPAVNIARLDGVAMNLGGRDSRCVEKRTRKIDRNLRTGETSSGVKPQGICGLRFSLFRVSGQKIKTYETKKNKKTEPNNEKGAGAE